ncbi:MAG: hypothetical protein AAF654_01455 [Myxococcota bacterium]
MRLVLICGVLAFAIVAQAAESPPDSDPLVLHARALLAEADGKTKRALEILRRAAKLTPLERDVAFDLARVSLASGPNGFVADSEPLLSLELKSTDERVLGAHARLARGDLDAASGLLNGLDDSSEAQELVVLIAEARTAEEPAARPPATSPPPSVLPASSPPPPTIEAPVVSETPPPEERSRLRFEVTLLGQYDDNPTVAPEDAVAATLGVSAQESPRFAVDLGVGYTLAESETYVSDLRLSLGYGYYLEGPDTVEVDVEETSDASAFGESARDFNGLNAVVSYYNLWASSDWLITAEGTVIGSTLDETEFYSAGASANASALYDLGGVRLGLYGRGGYLYFDNSLLSGVDGDNSERRGPTAGGGGVLSTELRLGTGRLQLQGRGGYQLEELGENFDESGLETDLTVSLMWGEVSFSVLGGYSLRDYGAERSDTLLTASANLGWAFLETYSLLGGYLLIRNTSDNEIFEYSRQVMFAGLQAVW